MKEQDHEIGQPDSSVAVQVGPALCRLARPPGAEQDQEIDDPHTAIDIDVTQRRVDGREPQSSGCAADPAPARYLAFIVGVSIGALVTNPARCCPILLKITFGESLQTGASNRGDAGG